ncbi:hypothetical protein CCP2SC5_160035 [Azospirillaceae bacterium]
MRVLIKTKLMMAFGFIILLAAIIAGVGILRLGDLNTATNELIHVKGVARAHVNQIMMRAHYFARLERDVLIADNEEGKSKFIAQMKTVDSEIDNRALQLQPLLTDITRPKLAGFTAAWKKYTDISERMQKLTLQNTNTKARDLSIGEGRKAANTVVESLLAIIDRGAVKKDPVAVQAATLSGHIMADALMIHRAEKNIILLSSDEAIAKQIREVEAWRDEIKKYSAQLRDALVGDGARFFDAFFAAYQSFDLIAERVRVTGALNNDVKLQSSWR